MRPSPFGNASIHDNANHDKQANFNTQQRGYSDIRSQKRGFARRLLELHVPPTTTTSSTAQDTGHRRVRCSNGATPAAAHGETQSVPPGYRPVQTWLVSSVNFGAIRSHQPDSHERRRDAIQSQLSGLYIAACAMCRGLLQTGLDNVRPARSLRVLLFASIASYCPTHTIDNVTDGTTPGGGGRGRYQEQLRTPHLSMPHTAPFLLFCISISGASPSLPMILAHKAFLERAVFQVPHKVVVPVRVACTRSSSPGTACAFGSAIRRGWVVCWRRLQTHRRIGIQMTHDPLQRRRDARLSRLLLIHGRCSLAPSTGRGLCIQVLRLVVLPRLLWLHHVHGLTVLRCLGGVGWRCALVVRPVHVVRVLLGLRVLCGGVLVHLHVCIRGVLGSLCLLLLRDRLLLLLLSLSAHALVSLLLLDTRCWRSARTRLERHWRYKWPRKLGLCDERMKFRLRRRPAFQRVEIEQSLGEIDKGSPIVHF